MVTARLMGNSYDYGNYNYNYNGIGFYFQAQNLHDVCIFVFVDEEY